MVGSCSELTFHHETVLDEQARKTGTGCGVVGGNHGRNCFFPFPFEFLSNSFSNLFQFLVGENHGRNCSFPMSFSIPLQFRIMVGLFFSSISCSFSFQFIFSSFSISFSII